MYHSTFQFHLRHSNNFIIISWWNTSKNFHLIYHSITITNEIVHIYIMEYIANGKWITRSRRQRLNLSQKVPWYVKDWMPDIVIQGVHYYISISQSRLTRISKAAIWQAGIFFLVHVLVAPGHPDAAAYVNKSQRGSASWHYTFGSPIYEECCARDGYQRRGQVITSHRYCGM